MTQGFEYLNGFNQHFESEAIGHTLPQSRNSPQQVAHGLYAEQLSGVAFTASRDENRFSWLYRIQPSVVHGEFKLLEHELLMGPPENANNTPPNQMRWDPLPIPEAKITFLQSLMTFAGNGSIADQTGAAIHLYACNQSMQDEYFFNSDGELLIVTQQGKLQFDTEFGSLQVEPAEIIVIPRGVKFKVTLLDENARGYICENFGPMFRLPELGVIGANGLANPRDFKYPTARFEEKTGQLRLTTKFQGRLWAADIGHSPLNVVAWHGNYAPYKYDLRLFNAIGTVSFDHPDPSIFTVLTAPSNTSGVANVDFAIFPPRWMVARDTFRPPYYHRNIMSEYMGLIYGVYDAKENGFVPGGSSLHNCMAAHGPDLDAFNKASKQELQPEYYDRTMAFMFESRQLWNLTAAALYAKFRQSNYQSCWQGLKSNFKQQSHLDKPGKVSAEQSTR